jgi:hypothetical protein
MNFTDENYYFYWLSLSPTSRHFTFFVGNEETGHQTLLAECILPSHIQSYYSDYLSYVDNIMGDIVLANVGGM